MARGMRGLGPPEYLAFAHRRRDLNELLWPALVSFRDYRDRWIQAGRPLIDTNVNAGSDEPLRFDPRRVLSEEGHQRFVSALLRSIVTTIAAEFEPFIDAFWRRIHRDPYFTARQKTQLFDATQIQQILNELSQTATGTHMMHKAFARELTTELARFTPPYTAHLVALQSYFREIRNSLVHNGAMASGRLKTSSDNLRGLSIKSAGYWRRHKFDVRYYKTGERIELTPRTTIAMMHFLNEFVEMLASHLANGRLGEAMFDERLGLAVDRAVEWIRNRRITSQRRLSDDAFMERRIRQALDYDGLKIPRTQDGLALLAQLIADIRASLRQH